MSCNAANYFRSLALYHYDSFMHFSPNLRPSILFLILSPFPWIIIIFDPLLIDLWWKVSSVFRPSMFYECTSPFHRARFIEIATCGLCLMSNAASSACQIKPMSPITFLDTLMSLLFQDSRRVQNRFLFLSV